MEKSLDKTFSTKDEKNLINSQKQPLKDVEIVINGKKILAKEGQTILRAAQDSNIYIPSLCYLEGIHQFGGCRMCMVEVEGNKNLVASCLVDVREGMVVRTNTARVRQARKINCELLLSDHPQDCLSCERSGSCELQTLAHTLGITQRRFEGEFSGGTVDFSSSITRDTTKCIQCRRCVSVCNEVQGIGILYPQGRGFNTTIGPPPGLSIAEVDCTNCGQCVTACPVNALSETSDIEKVWDAIYDPQMRVVVQIAPAVRVGIGEEFGLPIGEAVTGKLATALKEMLFDDIFDTNFGADLTIMEEGTEFLDRAKQILTKGKGIFPMITSCSPGWVTYLEHTFPKSVENLSTCKSPHIMLGAIVKSYYANKLKLDPQKIFVVSVMPCTAKKYEAQRPELQNDGYSNVDAVITTRELARMIREAGIDFANLNPSDFDQPMGISTGAADIFGITGGVMEAAMRTVYEIVTGREFPIDMLDLTPTYEGSLTKTGEFIFKDCLPAYDFLENFKVKVAITSGFKGAKEIMEAITKDKEEFHFVEIMGCPGGCVTGGGQPRTTVRNAWANRAQGLLNVDKAKKMRKSHENPAIDTLYREFLKEPLGTKPHELLHTHYIPRGTYNELLEEKEDITQES